MERKKDKEVSIDIYTKTNTDALYKNSNDKKDQMMENAWLTKNQMP